MREELRRDNEQRELRREAPGERESVASTGGPLYRRKSLDEVVAESGKPLMTFEQFVQEWEGVFPPEYWDTVLRIVDER
jgi:hypothetical protein